MRPSVSTSAADGTEIPFEMEILVNGNQVLTSGKSIFVDDDQPFKITAEVAAIKNCYQPHSQPHEGAYND